MPDIHLRRDHALGLPAARKMAWHWAEEVEKKFEMECTVVEGKAQDVVEFKRSGVDGTLVVAADHFELNAKLGFLLGTFAKTIKAQVEEQLDALLAAAHAKPAAKKAAKKA